MIRSSLCVLLLLLASLSLCDVSFELWSMRTSLSQQVRLCDIAGIGTVTGSSASHIKLNVESYWLGNPGSNTLHIVSDGENMPVAAVASNIVFFATTNMHYRADIEDLSRPFVDPGISPFDWDYPSTRTNALRTVPLSFLGGGRGWFYTGYDEGAMMALASNLVVACRTNPNSTNYYSLIRLETKVDEPNRLTKLEKLYALLAGVSDGGSNIVSLIANDKNGLATIRNDAIWRIEHDMASLLERTEP